MFQQSKIIIVCVSIVALETVKLSPAQTFNFWTTWLSWQGMRNESWSHLKVSQVQKHNHSHDPTAPRLTLPLYLEVRLMVSTPDMLLIKPSGSRLVQEMDLETVTDVYNSQRRGIILLLTGVRTCFLAAIRDANLGYRLALWVGQASHGRRLWSSLQPQFGSPSSPLLRVVLPLCLQTSCPCLTAHGHYNIIQSLARPVLWYMFITQVI